MARVIAIQPISSSQAHISDLTGLLYDSSGKPAAKEEVSNNLTEAFKSGILERDVKGGLKRSACKFWMRCVLL